MQLRDHRVLLKALAEVRPLIMDAGDDMGPAYRRLLEQMRCAYAAHKLVCARFGGNREPSLRMSTCANSTAVDVLHRLETSRLRAASPGAAPTAREAGKWPIREDADNRRSGGERPEPTSMKRT